MQKNETSKLELFLEAVPPWDSRGTARARVHNMRHGVLTRGRKTLSVQRTRRALGCARATTPTPATLEACDKVFALSGALTVHLRVHRSDKPCTCTACGKAFSDPTHFAKHLRTHTE